MAEILRLRDDAPPAAPVFALDAFLDEPGARAVRVEAGEDVTRLFPHLGRIDLVEIAFPRFRDGRGFSSARLLREAGYAGELRAAGDVLVDLIAFMRRCGFDAFAPDAPLDGEDVANALSRFPFSYQHASDAAVPIWKLRHG